MDLMTVWNNVINYRAGEWVEMTGLPAQTFWDLYNGALAVVGSYVGSIALSLSAGISYY